MARKSTYNKYYNLVRRFRRLNEHRIANGQKPIDAERAAEKIVIGEGSYYEDLLKASKSGRYYLTGSALYKADTYARLKHFIDRNPDIEWAWLAYEAGKITYDEFIHEINKYKRSIEYLSKGES